MVSAVQELRVQNRRYFQHSVYVAVQGSGRWFSLHKNDKSVYTIIQRLIKLSFSGTTLSTNGGCDVGIHICHFTKTLINLNKAIKGFQKANKIKDIMLINSFTHHNRFIQYKQSLETCKAHTYRPYKDCLTQHNRLIIFSFSFTWPSSLNANLLSVVQENKSHARVS